MSNHFKFDESKAMNVFIYIANRLGAADIYRIFKILYLADIKHVSKFGRPIIGDVYHALPAGPVPTQLYDDFKIVKGNFFYSLIHPQKKARLSQYFDTNGYMVFPKVEPDLDELSKSDVDCIEESIIENKDLTFGQLKTKTHDLAYHNANSNGPISFDDIAKVGGADEEMIHYIEEANKYPLYKPA